MPASFQPSVCKEGLAVLRRQPVDDPAEEAEHPDFGDGDRRHQHRIDDDEGPGAARVVQAEARPASSAARPALPAGTDPVSFQTSGTLSWHSIDVKARAASGGARGIYAYRIVVRPWRSLDRRANRRGAGLVFSNIGRGEAFAENGRERRPELRLGVRPAFPAAQSPHRKSADARQQRPVAWIGNRPIEVDIRQHAAMRPATVPASMRCGRSPMANAQAASLPSCRIASSDL